MAGDAEEGGSERTRSSSTSIVRGPGMPGRHKAAVLLVSLGPENAARIFRHMRDEELETLALEMAKLDSVDSSASSSVFEELASTMQARESIASGGIEYAREVLDLALGPDRSVEVMGRLSSVIERRPFEFLRRTPAEQIITFLRNESPQTVALVVASLHTTLAAQVLSHLSESEQSQIALRIARMGETSPEVVRAVEHVIRQKLATIAPADLATSGGVKSLAEILNQVDRSTERNVLDSISSADEELGEEVRRRLFVFEDIAKLDDRGIQLILREADQKDLALALRGVPEEVKTRILANMSERGSQMLQEEMEFQPPQRRRVVEEAQGRIVAIVRKLEESDELVVSRGETDVLL
jgi:flagellar motor switch protein FliG